MHSHAATWKLSWTQFVDKHFPLNSTKLLLQEIHFGWPSTGQSSPFAARPLAHTHWRRVEVVEPDVMVTVVVVEVEVVVAVVAIVVVVGF